MSSSAPSFSKLNGSNYATWAGDMEAWLKAQALWRIVNGTSKRPSLEGENADTKPLDEWDAKSDKAAGWIWLTLKPDQKALVSSCKDSPVTMWTTLQSTYLQKKAGSRFNAYDDLFSIRKLEDETLQSLINRVDEAVKLIQDLRPTSFSLEQLDKELAAMVLIRALPEEYNTFVSSLLLLDKLDKKTVQDVFITEEIQRCRRAADISSSAAAMAASSAQLKCDFCGRSGHAIATCYSYASAQKRAQEDAASRASGRRKKTQQHAKQAQDASPAPATAPSAPSGEKEFAGNASTSVSGPVDSSAYVQSHADFRWNADSGCTSHMTAHRHWIRGYRPYRTPVELADGSVIYSVGIGSVVFDPVIDGKRAQLIEMGRVLHVPQLRSNLLSCLYLTRCSGFKIVIDSNFMHFMRDEKLHFRARITSYNAAYIDATTIPR